MTFFFRKSWKNVVDSGRGQMAIWRMRIASWMPNATNTPILCNTYCLSNATVVARTHLNVTLYVHCDSCNMTPPSTPKSHKRFLFLMLPHQNYVRLAHLIFLDLITWRISDDDQKQKVITHMCPFQSVLWRTGVEGYRRQITTATLSEQGRLWTED